MSEPDPAFPSGIPPLELKVISVFVDGVKALGLPKSIGEIYGLLFISPQPLSLDDLVKHLDISKGSASQGLRMLRRLGAVREAETKGPTGRRTYYEPAIELKRLAGGFIREQIRPHLQRGHDKVDELAKQSRELDDPEARKFLEHRIGRLQQWMRSGKRVLPLLQKLLGQ